MPYGQSQWEDNSAAAVGGVNNFNHMRLAVARMKYSQAVQQQRMALALGQQAMREEMMKNQVDHNAVIKKHYEMMDARAGAGRALDQEKIKAANDLGTAGWNQQMQIPEGGTTADATVTAFQFEVPIS